jgi:cell division GTPase FtsZ
LKNTIISQDELTKVINKTESIIAFEDMSVSSRASSLAMYELLGDANMMNTEFAKYQKVTARQIQEECTIIFQEANSNTMYYLSDNAAQKN